jgi:photosystem II stability/assembly factor-like uncharacterized protein
MADQSDLESLYQEAQAEISSRKYDHASELLKQILVIDENYKDASRLLAQTVKLKRRRWYNDPRLWGGLGVIMIIAFLTSRIPKLHIETKYQPTITNTTIPTLTLTPTRTAIPSQTPTLAPTQIPLTWKRIHVGQQFTRDSITAIILDPTDPDVIYAGAQNAGVYKSIDGGKSWQPAQHGLRSGKIGGMAIDPNNPLILYATVIEGGIYKTEDGGQSWRKLHGGKVSNEHIAVAPWDSKVIFQWGGNGNYRSYDGGETFSPIATGCLAESYFSISPSQPDTLYLSNLLDPFGDSTEGCTGGIYRSRDRGSTWELIGLEGYYQVGGTWGAFAVGGKEDRYLYIEANPNSSRTGAGSAVFASSDGGATWYIAKNGCTSIHVNPLDGREVYCWVFHEEYPSVSYDAGRTWKRLKPTETSSFQAFSLYRSENITLVGGDGLFASYDNGTTWRELSAGLGAQHLELKINPWKTDSLYVQEGLCNLFKNQTLHQSSDGGLDWKIIGLQGCDLAFDADGSTLYRNYVYTRDGGITWQGMGPLSPYKMQDVLSHPVQSGKVLLFSGDGGEFNSYISLNYGETWEKLQASGNPRGGYPRAYTDSLGAVIYLMTGSRGYYSSDEGSSWLPCKDIRTTLGDQILAIDPRNNKHLYATTSGNGILVSWNGCQSWMESNSELGSLFVNAIVIDPRQPDTIYAGTDGGAYVSLDGGKSWAQINDGLLGATVVYSIVVDKDSGVYAATPYGIFKLEGK